MGNCHLPRSHSRTVFDEKKKTLDLLMVNVLVWTPREQSLRQELECMGFIWGCGPRGSEWERKKAGTASPGYFVKLATIVGKCPWAHPGEGREELLSNDSSDPP